jgi:hypothetical protein
MSHTATAPRTRRPADCLSRYAVADGPKGNIIYTDIHAADICN